MTEVARRVLHVTGLVDDRWATLVADAVADPRHDELVVDLSDAILVSRSPLSGALQEVIRSGGDLSAVAFVCPRISATMLLKRWGITDHVAVYPTHEECEAALDGGSRAKEDRGSGDGRSAERHDHRGDRGRQPESSVQGAKG
jgi:hypothetical protein